MNHPTVSAPREPAGSRATLPAPHIADVIIIGAGPAGLAGAIALGQAGMKVMVVERQDPAQIAHPAADGRDIALTHRAIHLLQDLGIFRHIPAAEIYPIREARVMNGQSPFFLSFGDPSPVQGALGHLVSNQLIRQASWDTVQALPNVTIVAGAIVQRVDNEQHRVAVHLADSTVLSARLLIAADSRFSSIRRSLGIGADMLDFGRAAIVCRMTHSGPHHGVARECFGYAGTLALLPLAEQLSSVVLTLPAHEAADLMNLDDAHFDDEVGRRAGQALGTMQLTGNRHSYPLVAAYARRFAAGRAVLLGDAAVGMHPVTAHGYNFGLYGAKTLTDLVIAAYRSGQDIGDSALLDRYDTSHRRATRFIYLGTNALVQLYTDASTPARIARRTLLRVANRLPPVKRWVTGQLTTA